MNDPTDLPPCGHPVYGNAMSYTPTGTCGRPSRWHDPHSKRANKDCCDEHAPGWAEERYPVATGRKGVDRHRRW